MQTGSMDAAAITAVLRHAESNHNWAPVRDLIAVLEGASAELDALFLNHELNTAFARSYFQRYCLRAEAALRQAAAEQGTDPLQVLEDDGLQEHADFDAPHHWFFVAYGFAMRSWRAQEEDDLRVWEHLTRILWERLSDVSDARNSPHP